MMRSAVVCLLVVAAAAGCAKQPSVTQTSAPAPTGSPPAPSGVADQRGPSRDPVARAAATNPSSSRRASMPQAGAVRPEPREYVDIAELRDIHFDFDRYDLRAGERRVLEGHAAWLRRHAGTLLLVEGHCDPRGTAEYNVSLGERRAKATATYLTSLGIASHRITIVSYGEERPLCREEGEDCWSRNRRAHFRVKQQ